MTLHHQKGIAALEFTIILPFMLLLIYATGEFGRLLYQYNVLTQLTRDAARYVTQPTADTSGVVNLNDALLSRTRNVLIYGKETTGTTPLLYGLSSSDITISEVSTGIVAITVNYNWTPILGNTMPTFGLGEDIDLSFNLRTEYAMRALL